MEDIKSFISKRVHELCETKEVSAREMSLSLGLNHSYINKVKNGQALPSYEMLDCLCAYCGIRVSDFFNEGNQNPVEMEELLIEAKKLNRESLRLLVGLAKQLNMK